MKDGILSFNLIALIYYLLNERRLSTVNKVIAKGFSIVMERYNVDKSFIIDTGNGAYTTKWLMESITDGTIL